MLAAIYARKSTEQNVSDDAKSVTRQVDLARAFALSKGWTVAEAHVYQDDGLSGAEFLKRDGLNALLAAVRAKPCPFQVLVTMESSRLGREQTETAIIVREIRRAGVRVFTYADGREITLDSALDKFTFSALTFVSEMEREFARTRTREAMRAKAKAGHVAGGKVYGYRNIREGSHVRREVYEPEAQVVRRIFTLCAEGAGLFRIAQALNAEGVRSPRGDGWATTAIREMLRRDLYRGRIVYGKTRWQDQRGTKVKVDAPENEWLTLEAPELRIVPEELWRAAHARLDRTRQTYTGQRKANGELHGRPEAGLVSRHLLSGFLRCGTCGGNLFVAPVTGTRSKPRLFYRCTTHYKRGQSRCANRWGVPYDAITEAIVGQFTPETFERILLEQPAPEPEDFGAQRKALEEEATRLDKALGNLTEAIATGGDIPALVERLKATQRQREQTEARLKALDEWEAFDPAEVLREALQDEEWGPWKLQDDPVEGRAILRQVLTGPIVVTPTLDATGALTGWEYLGPAALDRVLAGRLQAKSVLKRNTTELVPPG